VDPSGNVYVTGFSFGLPTAEQDFVTIKYDADGNQQWVSRYNGPADNWDEAFKILLDAAGNVYVSGRSNHSSFWFDFDFLTIKYDNGGQEQWAARFNGTGNDWDQANDFVVDGDGNVYVTGHAAKQLGTAYHDCTTIKYNSAGVQQWVRLFDGAGQNWDEGVGIALDGLGHVIVAGFQSGVGTVYDYITLQYDLNGNLQWNRTYNSGISFSADVLRDLEVDTSGNIYVTGPSVLDYATVKYDPSGNEQWVRRFGAAADDVPFSLDISALGNVFVTGASAGNYVTLKYDPAGNLQWNHVYDGPAAGNAADTSQCVVVDAFENVYLTGFSPGSSSGPDIATIKLEQPGAVGVEPLVLGSNELLGQNHPNPFFNKTAIPFSISPGEAGPVKLRVLDVRGRVLETLVNRSLSAGAHSFEWTGGEHPAGFYFYRLDAGGRTETRKMILAR
jgi:hypothetical protein